MNIKIESGAKVQITDKPIYNIYGDVVQQKNVLPPTSKTKQKADKKPFDPDTFRETFTYAPEGMSKKERSIRLKMAFNKAKGILIASDTHYDTFEALLSGKPLDIKIYWTGTNSQLRCLFNMLVTKNHIVKKPTGGLNQILSARFKHEDGTPFSANEIKDAGSDGDMSVVNSIVEILTPCPVEVEDLEQQLRSLITEEQENNELGRIKAPKQEGMVYGNRPNQHTRAGRKKQ